MACEHKRLKSVNCVIMCADCGAVMPRQYAAGGETTGTSSVSAKGAATFPDAKQVLQGRGEGKGDAAETTEPKKRGRKKKEA